LSINDSLSNRMCRGDASVVARYKQSTVRLVRQYKCSHFCLVDRRWRPLTICSCGFFYCSRFVLCVFFACLCGWHYHAGFDVPEEHGGRQSAQCIATVNEYGLQSVVAARHRLFATKRRRRGSRDGEPAARFRSEFVQCLEWQLIGPNHTCFPRCGFARRTLLTSICMHRNRSRTTSSLCKVFDAL
jgi:hypothetical protein